MGMMLNYASVCIYAAHHIHTRMYPYRNERKAQYGLGQVLEECFIGEEKWPHGKGGKNAVVSGRRGEQVENK